MLSHGRKHCTADPAFTGEVNHDQNQKDHNVRSSLLGPDLFDSGEQTCTRLLNLCGIWGV